MGIRFFTTSSGVGYTDLPRRLRRSERKPLLTGINELKRKVRLQKEIRREVQEITLQPPENGLLVKSLVPIARDVFAARAELFRCVSAIADVIHVHVCRVCGEVHVGSVPHHIHTCNVAGSLPSKKHCWARGGVEHVLPLVDSFHLYDRLGRAVSHKEQLLVDRIPAILELCVQAGVDIPEFPTKRRLFPVYNVAGKIIDFERKYPREYMCGKDIQPYGFWLKQKSPENYDANISLVSDDIQGIGMRGMEAWEKMRSGAIKLMQKYAVQTCGFCLEVQVGRKGHRVRNCQAYKHQLRNGQHSWQEATVDDLVPPVYVWHAPDAKLRKPLVNDLKRYYGKLPAAVELFAQAGASVGDEYSGVMRCDIAIPQVDEEKLVV